MRSLVNVTVILLGALSLAALSGSRASATTLATPELPNAVYHAVEGSMVHQECVDDGAGQCRTEWAQEPPMIVYSFDAGGWSEPRLIPVPEPGGLVMIAVGLGALAIFARRRRR